MSIWSWDKGTRRRPFLGFKTSNFKVVLLSWVQTPKVERNSICGRMSDEALRVLDGLHLRAVDLSLPEPDVILTGAQILDIADSRASSSLFGLPLPDSVRASALVRIGADDVHAFRSSEFAKEKASEILRDYIAAIADELKGSYLFVLVRL